MPAFPKIVRYILSVLLVITIFVALIYLESIYIAHTITKEAYSDQNFYHKGYLTVYAVSRCWKTGCAPHVRPIFWANPFSFEKVNAQYAKDNFSVFCDHEIIWEASYPQHHVRKMAADPQSFKVLSATYAIDATAGFFACNHIPSVDVSTFTTIDTYLARDAKQYYFKQTPTHIPYNEDTQIIPLTFGKDGYLILQDNTLNCLEHADTFKSTYDLRLSESKIISRKIDEKTFSYLRDGYSADTNQTYYHCQILEPSINPTYLGDGYLQVGTHVYYYGKLLAKANAQNFKLITGDEFKKLEITKNITDGVPQYQPPYYNKTVGFDGQYYFIFGKTVEPVN